MKSYGCALAVAAAIVLILVLALHPWPGWPILAGAGALGLLVLVRWDRPRA